MTNEIETEETKLNEDEKKLLEELLNDELNELSEHGDARRKFLKQVSAASAAILATQLLVRTKSFCSGGRRIFFKCSG